jgi:hypothetical protein
MRYLRRAAELGRGAALLLSFSLVGCSSDTGPSIPSSPTPLTKADGGPHDADRPLPVVDSGPPPPSSGGCSVERVTKCPTSKPSYKNDVIPILEARCYACHSSTDGGGPWPLTTLVDIQDWKTQFISDVQSCAMPPVDAGAKLSSEEATTLLGWLVCGAPNN